MYISTAAGECLTCGDNSRGQLGRREEASGGNRPAVVETLTGKLMELVSCGDFYTTVSCKGKRFNLTFFC